MKKTAFTLAEVLITLGIIGVVAALTAPALVKNTGRAKIGPSLAKFVNTFETATETMLSDNGVDKISSLADDVTAFTEGLSKYMIMSPVQESAPYTVFEPNSNKDASKVVSNQGLSANNAQYVLKDGSFMAANFNASKGSGKGPYKGIIGSIAYDINGYSGNNEPAKEVFYFFIDDSGILIPYGSNAHKYIDYINYKTCAPTDAEQAKYCAGKIADHGWKAEY